jgi:hypothetical protein
MVARTGGASGTRSNGRRGIILLFILGLLALFSLVTVTFVVVARTHKRGAAIHAQIERTGDSPEQLTKTALLQVLRGTNNAASTLRAHSLLEDMYGSDGLKGAMVAPTMLPADQFNSQFIPLGTLASNVTFPTLQWTPAPQLSQVPNYYTGRVLTMIEGPCAGESVRIVDYTYASGTGVFWVMPFKQGRPLQGNQFVVNGAPFNGTGFGFNLQTYQNNPALPLLNFPNAVTGVQAFAPNHQTYVPSTGYPDPAGLGGADEDYDAADYQNLLLAMRAITSNTSSPYYPSQVVLPSLHRPDLVSYVLANQNTPIPWTSWNTAAATIPLRSVMLRPVGGFVGADHPNFTGSNPSFHPVTGPWDIDNDNDGKPDSVWVDLGLPVQTTPDGRTYKPLFAILCEDLDGRLNLNAHGNANQLVMPTSVEAGAGVVATGTTKAQAPTAGSDSMGGTVAKLPVGQGYGPAEINLGIFFNQTTNNTVSFDEFDNLLFGVKTGGVFTDSVISVTFGLPTALPSLTNELLLGRYGELDVPLSEAPAAGRTDEGANGIDPTMDMSAWWKMSDFAAYNSKIGTPSNYGTRSDLDGDGVLAVDPSGNLVFPNFAQNESTGMHGMGERWETRNSAYDLDLSRNAPRTGLPTSKIPYTIDAPFQPTELERILRYNDLDAPSLPDRLLRLAPFMFTGRSSMGSDLPGNAEYRRRLVTTESWDLPIPSLGPSADVLAPGAYLNQTLYASAAPASATLLDRIATITPTSVNRAIVLNHLGGELSRGLKFDINRPFGDGIDNDGDWLVDEPDEATEYAWPQYYGSTVQFKHNTSLGGTTLDREQYARSLYMLVMMLMDQQFVDREYPASNPAKRMRLATQVAQWAVNVTDFRDSDSIMTGFEFDAAPFTDENSDGDPWDVNGDLMPNEVAAVRRGVVWGCERPELLLTETLALHDRRAEDTNQDTDGPQKTTGPTMSPPPDDDFDQKESPQGSLFVEVYNPWSVATPASPAFLAPSGSPTTPPNAAQGVPLGKLSGATGGSAVWRMLITQTDEAPDKIDIGGTFTNTKAEGVVYFTALAGAPSDSSIANPNLVKYYANVTAPVLPGGYAVVGPPGTTELGSSSTDRKAVMPAVNMTQPFTVHDSTGTAILPYNTISTMNPTVKSALAVPVPPGGTGNNTRFSISEPYNGYTMAPGTVYDTPKDKIRADLSNPRTLWVNATLPAYRHVHLQRLADPTRPWDADTNPYLTIDSLPIDLTVFNSKPGNETTTSDPVANGVQNFNSRERTGQPIEENGATDFLFNLWSQSSRQSTITTGGTPAIGNPTVVARTSATNHTLGFLNESYQKPPTVTTSQRRLGSSDYGGGYVGLAELTPFPLLHWPNRPYISVMELLQAPAYSSSRLLQAHWLQSGVAPNHYKSTATAKLPLPNMSTADPLRVKDVVFRHQIPWLLTSVPTGTGPPLGPHIYRAFDYLHVPSRYAGTDTYLNAQQFAAGPNAWNPPFNKISRYREPGKININTICDDGLTWKALTNNYETQGAATGDPANSDQLWQLVAQSRRGWQPNEGASSLVHESAPMPLTSANAQNWLNTAATLIANPFRSSAGNVLVPTEPLRQDMLGNTRAGIESTLLRSRPEGNGRPLFATSNDLTPGTTALPPAAATNTSRNSMFHYQLLTKLGNLVTTRSNVYAVWVTVGYFEVNRVQPNAADPGFCPDGWQLGRELGADTGEIKRHRAFFLIDRTIPVGFLRGEDLNVEECVLLERYIE